MNLFCLGTGHRNISKSSYTRSRYRYLNQLRHQGRTQRHLYEQELIRNFKNKYEYEGATLSDRPPSRRKFQNHYYNHYYDHNHFKLQQQGLPDEQGSHFYPNHNDDQYDSDHDSSSNPDDSDLERFQEAEKGLLDANKILQVPFEVIEAEDILFWGCPPHKKPRIEYNVDSDYGPQLIYYFNDNDIDPEHDSGSGFEENQNQALDQDHQQNRNSKNDGNETGEDEEDENQNQGQKENEGECHENENIRNCDSNVSVNFEFTEDRKRLVSLIPIKSSTPQSDNEILHKISNEVLVPQQLKSTIVLSTESLNRTKINDTHFDNKENYCSCSKCHFVQNQNINNNFSVNRNSCSAFRHFQTWNPFFNCDIPDANYNQSHDKNENIQNQDSSLPQDFYRRESNLNSGSTANNYCEYHINPFYDFDIDLKKSFAITNDDDEVESNKSNKSRSQIPKNPTPFESSRSQLNNNDFFVNWSDANPFSFIFKNEDELDPEGDIPEQFRLGVDADTGTETETDLDLLTNHDQDQGHQGHPDSTLPDLHQIFISTTSSGSKHSKNKNKSRHRHQCPFSQYESHYYHDNDYDYNCVGKRNSSASTSTLTSTCSCRIFDVPEGNDKAIVVLRPSVPCPLHNPYPPVSSSFFEAAESNSNLGPGPRPIIQEYTSEAEDTDGHTSKKKEQINPEDLDRRCKSLSAKHLKSRHLLSVLQITELTSNTSSSLSPTSSTRTSFNDKEQLSLSQSQLHSDVGVKEMKMSYLMDSHDTTNTNTDTDTDTYTSTDTDTTANIAEHVDSENEVDEVTRTATTRTEVDIENEEQSKKQHEVSSVFLADQDTNTYNYQDCGHKEIVAMSLPAVFQQLLDNGDCNRQRRAISIAITQQHHMEVHQDENQKVSDESEINETKYHENHEAPESVQTSESKSKSTSKTKAASRNNSKTRMRSRSKSTFNPSEAAKSSKEILQLFKRIMIESSSRLSSVWEINSILSPRPIPGHSNNDKKSRSSPTARSPTSSLISFSPEISFTSETETAPPKIDIVEDAANVTITNTNTDHDHYDLDVTCDSTLFQQLEIFQSDSMDGENFPTNKFYPPPTPMSNASKKSDRNSTYSDTADKKSPRISETNCESISRTSAKTCESTRSKKQLSEQQKTRSTTGRNSAEVKSVCKLLSEKKPKGGSSPGIGIAISNNGKVLSKTQTKDNDNSNCVEEIGNDCEIGNANSSSPKSNSTSAAKLNSNLPPVGSKKSCRSGHSGGSFEISKSKSIQKKLTDEDISYSPKNNSDENSNAKAATNNGCSRPSTVKFKQDLELEHNESETMFKTNMDQPVTEHDPEIALDDIVKSMLSLSVDLEIQPPEINKVAIEEQEKPKKIKSIIKSTSKFQCQSQNQSQNHESDTQMKPKLSRKSVNRNLNSNSDSKSKSKWDSKSKSKSKSRSSTRTKKTSSTRINDKGKKDENNVNNAPPLSSVPSPVDVVNNLNIVAEPPPPSSSNVIQTNTLNECEFEEIKKSCFNCNRYSSRSLLPSSTTTTTAKDYHSTSAKSDSFFIPAKHCRFKKTYKNVKSQYQNRVSFINTPVTDERKFIEPYSYSRNGKSGGKYGFNSNRNQMQTPAPVSTDVTSTDAISLSERSKYELSKDSRPRSRSQNEQRKRTGKGINFDLSGGFGVNPENCYSSSQNLEYNRHRTKAGKKIPTNLPRLKRTSRLPNISARKYYEHQYQKHRSGYCENENSSESCSDKIQGHEDQEVDETENEIHLAALNLNSSAQYHKEVASRLGNNGRRKGTGPKSKRLTLWQKMRRYFFGCGSGTSRGNSYESIGEEPLSQECESDRQSSVSLFERIVIWWRRKTHRQVAVHHQDSLQLIRIKRQKWLKEMHEFCQDCKTINNNVRVPQRRRDKRSHNSNEKSNPNQNQNRKRNKETEQRRLKSSLKNYESHLPNPNEVNNNNNNSATPTIKIINSEGCVVILKDDKDKEKGLLDILNGNKPKEKHGNQKSTKSKPIKGILKNTSESVKANQKPNPNHNPKINQKQKLKEFQMQTPNSNYLHRLPYLQNRETQISRTRARRRARSYSQRRPERIIDYKYS